MSIHYREQGSAIIVLGNTYPYRDQLKALGARFNGDGKNWRVPMSPRSLTMIAELCSASGGGSLAPLSVQSVPASLSPESAGEPTVTCREDDGSLTIRQLMERVEQAVATSFPQALWITGEVQNYSLKASGVFFDLAEGRTSGHANATVTVRAIIWQSILAALGEQRGAEAIAAVLQDGMKIRCLCQVQLYKDRGSLSLLVTDIDPSFTKGALALAREKLLKELRAKGLDQANKKLVMPRFPLHVGLISADASRAKSDFLDQLFSLGFPGRVTFGAAVMQGEQVPKQVVAALSALAAAGCDLIVLTRGGGSAADLRWFDAAEIAYAISRSAVPIIAAIGHHEDLCVAEEVCYLRQKTPTAAADFVISLFAATKQFIDTLAKELATALEQRTQECQQRLTAAGERLAAAAQLAVEGRGVQVTTHIHRLQRMVHQRLEERSARLVQQGHSLQRTSSERLHEHTSKVAHIQTTMNLYVERTVASYNQGLLSLAALLAQRDPAAWLAQGWTQLTGAQGRLLSVGDAAVGDLLKARLKDGWLALQVKDKDQTPPLQDDHR